MLPKNSTDIDIHSIPILSVCQPYAHLIVHGPKRIENRTWAPKYRGWIGIHASKGRKYMKDATFSNLFTWGRGSPEPIFTDPSVLQFGAIIGAAKLIACVRIAHPDAQGKRILEVTTPPDAPFRNFPWVFDDPWFEGPVGWVLEDATPIEPIPCRGQTGLFRIKAA